MRLNYGWKLWFSVVVLFLAGALVGASGTSYYFFQTRGFVRPPKSPLHARDQVLERMDKRLHLRPEQREAVARHLGEAMERGRRIMDSVEPQMTANIQEQYRMIMNVLDPEQQREFKKMHQRFEYRRKCFRKPFHQGHGARGRRCD